MEAYLDNAATTRVFPEVREKMVRVMEEDFGNPSSKHTKGMDAEKYIRETKEILAKDLKCTPGEIIFTSGGTESNNTAFFAGVRSEVLLHALAEKGVFVSSGSACLSNHPELSGTLKAIGVADELLDSTLRFSFSTDTTIEQIDYALEQLYNLLPMLRRFIRK